MGFNTTLGRLYLLELEEPFERLELQFVPGELSMNRQADLKQIAIVGRNNNLLQYTGGSDTLNLPIEFYSDSEFRDDVISKVNWLQSLAMSDGNNGPYRNVKLVFGNLFRNEIWAVSSVSPVLSHFDDKYNFLPLRATVEIRLILDPKTNLLFDQVRRPQLKGITKLERRDGTITA